MFDRSTGVRFLRFITLLAVIPGEGISDPACGSARIRRVASFAPWSVTRSQGVANPAVLTLQALLEDLASPHPTGFSVTNAVTVVIEE